MDVNKIKDVVIGICALVIVVLIGLITFFFFHKEDNPSNDNSEQMVSFVTDNEERVDEVIDKKEFSVDIKGSVKNPGVYIVSEGTLVNDQTTPNMIQRISVVFERKPLISKEI